MKRPAVIALAALALAATGCGGGGPVASPEEVDLENGLTQFQTRCGGCHTLAQAGTVGTQGPNLDYTYLGPRREGWDESSFEAMVMAQIKDPTPPMPSGLASGDDARDIAAYVAAAAARDVDDQLLAP